MKIHFTQPDGSARTVEVAPGLSLMEAALFNMIDGVIGLCGGICSCATCRCEIDDAWRARLPPPAPGEAAMLEALDDAGANSRLGCQIMLDEALDGLSVRVPLSRG